MTTDQKIELYEKEFIYFQQMNGHAKKTLIDAIMREFPNRLKRKDLKMMKKPRLIATYLIFDIQKRKQ